MDVRVVKFRVRGKLALLGRDERAKPSLGYSNVVVVLRNLV